MDYYELKVTQKLATNISSVQGHEYLSRLISFAMLQDAELKELHEKQQYKDYVFCNLFPIEPDKVYKQGRLYMWRIRSLNLKLLEKLKLVLSQLHKDIAATELRKISCPQITRLKTLTPVTATFDNKSWTSEMGLAVLMERIEANAEKKCRCFCGENVVLKDNFFYGLSVLSRKPLKIPYKKANFLAYKLLIEVKEDEKSQKLAGTVLGTGLLEKNAIGFGYCIYE